MPAFPLLLDVAHYRPCDWDLLEDDEARAEWLDFFASHFGVLAEQALASGYAVENVEAASADVQSAIESLRRDPLAFGHRVDILALDRIRDGALRAHGVDDPCKAVKRAQTRMALAGLHDRLRAIDATDEDERRVELLRGVLAGNLFDMGAAPTAGEFARATRLDFPALRKRVADRPWHIDDADEMHIEGRERVVIFADNAGSDCVLGMLPLAREFLRFGADVVLAANTGPTLNDVTASELRDVVEEAAGEDSAFESSQLSVVANGTMDPLIDLSEVSTELSEAAHGADLVVLIGMGRAIESNWLARFSRECWRLAVLKDPKVAKKRGGRLFDCIVRRTAPGR